MMGKEKLEQVYSWLSDDISKYIFEERIQFNNSNNQQHIRNIVSLDEEAKKIFESIYQVAERNLVIFGAGVRGKHCLDVFDNLEFQCFVDNNAKNIRGRKEENQVLPIFTLEECLGQIESPVFIVCNKSWYREIISQLLTAGVPQEDIIDFTTLANQYLERQYFDLPKLKEVKQEGAFIDGGSYDGLNSVIYRRKWAVN